MASIRSRLIRQLITLSPAKRNCRRLRYLPAGQFKSAQHPPKLRDHARYSINLSDVDGMPMWTFAPKHRISHKTVLYLHGGAYVNGLSRAHWTLIAQLVDATGHTFCVPEYPLAPCSNVSHAMGMLINLYTDLSKQTLPENIIFMGDSSGGGLCLALAQQLSLNNTRLPSRLMLLSPWLDASMTHPDIASLNAIDPLLDADGLARAGQLYAGELDIFHPWISPLYGPLTGLPPISLFIGTQDILFPDCKRLVGYARALDVSIDQHVYEDMFHGWMFSSMPEGRRAMEQIVELLQKSPSAKAAALPHQKWAARMMSAESESNNARSGWPAH